jgi:uncharacterized membrane protein
MLSESEVKIMFKRIILCAVLLLMFNVAFSEVSYSGVTVYSVETSYVNDELQLTVKGGVILDGVTKEMADKLFLHQYSYDSVDKKAVIIDDLYDEANQRAIVNLPEQVVSISSNDIKADLKEKGKEKIAKLFKVYAEEIKRKIKNMK